MLSSLDLEVMKSNPELSWKSVTKRRTSKKSVARSSSSNVKAGNSISPKRVGDFSGSDSDKFGEVIPKQENSGKSKNVPLKKRMHLLQSPSPHPWASSPHKQDSCPSKRQSPLLENHAQLQYPSYSSGDFFGIELLAAAASMDDDIDIADKNDILLEDSSVQKNSDASSSASLSKQCLKHNESVDSLSNISVPGGNMDSQVNNSSTTHSLSARPEDGTAVKVDRKHWDLNTLMDAWGEPYDDSVSGDTLKDVNGSKHMEEMEKHSGDHVPSQTAMTYENPSIKINQDMSTSAVEGVMCSEQPDLKDNLQDTLASIHSHTVKDTSNQACQKGPDDKDSIKALASGADLKRLNQVSILEANVGISPYSELCCNSGMLKFVDKSNAISGTDAMIHDGDCSSNMSECERTVDVNGSHTPADEVNAHDMDASESAINVNPEDIVYQTTSSSGTFTVDAQPVSITDSSKQTNGTFISNSTMVVCKQYLELSELGSKHDENCILPNENLKTTIFVDTCKSSSAGAQHDEPPIVGGIGLVVDGQCDPYVSQDDHVDMVNGDDLNGFHEGYDSPYEDGELRGSFLYSWEDNEMENECVDYESDGRNGEGSDAAEYNGSEIVEGGSEGSNGSRGSLSMKISAEDKSKSGIVKHAPKKYVVRAVSDNKDIARKESNAGSGSTVEQCVEVHMDESEGIKRSELLDDKNVEDFRGTHKDEYVSKAVKGKILSRIEGRSSAEATDGKGAFFIQQSSSRRFAGLYPRPERNISPDRYLGRYRSAAPAERDGVHQWKSWSPRRRYSTNYQGSEGRNNTRPGSKTGESANKIDGVEYHEPRQTNYLSKGLHRPVMRSPVERDEYFGVDRRLPLTRGEGSYRSRGNYSQRPSRDFLEDFEPLPDDTSASVRMPRYISRDRSFSPRPGRHTRMILPRQRSRSRSRTRSPPPRAWQNPQRDRILGARRPSRSPDFRTNSRMRMPFLKPIFASEYGEGYISPSRGQFSPQRNCRWVEDRKFADNNHIRRRSPVRMFRRTQRFDGERLKPDEYTRPVVRPGRFSFDDRRRDDGGEMSQRVVRRDDGGNMRRLRHTNDFDTKKRE